MFAILITHNVDWRNIVGPFNNKDDALRWIINHSISLEDAKCEILQMVN